MEKNNGGEAQKDDESSYRSRRIASQIDISKRVLTLEPSGVGNGCRSTTVTCVSLNNGFLQIACAVARPNTPLPMIRTEEGTSNGAVEAIMH
jgi:hypothetical protein